MIIVIILIILLLFFFFSMEGFISGGTNTECHGLYVDPTMVTCGNIKVGDLFCKPDLDDCFNVLNNGNVIQKCYCKPQELYPTN